MTYARRHPLLTVLVVALLVRVVVAVVVAMTTGGFVFGDDRYYWELASQAATGETASWGAYDRIVYRTTFTLLGPLTAVRWLVGDSPLAGQLLVGLAGAIAAVLTARLAREVVDRPAALGAGLVVALTPSMVLHSVVTIKDAVVWATLSGMAVALVAVCRTRSRRRLLLAGLGLVGTWIALAYLREHTLVVASWAVAAGAWFGNPGDRLARGASSVILAVAIPWIVGLGPMGLDLVTSAGDLTARRAANAEGAETAMVATEDPETGDRPRSRGLGSELAHIPKGLTVFLLEPLPWRDGNPRVRLAQAENVLVWYPLLLLGTVGGVRLLRRRPAVAVFPSLVAGGLTVVYTLVEGNFGTAFRHRGEIVWVLAVGTAFEVQRLVRRRHDGQAEVPHDSLGDDGEREPVADRLDPMNSSGL